MSPMRLRGVQRDVAGVRSLPREVTREELDNRLAERDSPDPAQVGLVPVLDWQLRRPRQEPLVLRPPRRAGAGTVVRPLVSVVQYPGIDHELAMAWGDTFKLEEVGTFQLADFARRCEVDKRLLQREATRLAKLAMEHAPTQALADDYVDEGERAFAGQLRDFVMGQADRLRKLAGEAAKIKDELL